MSIRTHCALVLVTWSVLAAGADSTLAGNTADLPPLSGVGILRVVATGDSITTGYSPVRLQRAFDADGIAAEVLMVASSGCASDRYIGLTMDPYTDTYRDYAAEVVELDPDVIIFMLGTNDAFRSSSTAFDLYTERVTGVLNTFDSTVNSRGVHPVVFISTLLPILSDDPDSSAYAAGVRIESSYNPWLRQQAPNYGFELVDINARIRTVPDWQDLYSPDGIHLWGQSAEGVTGYTWLATEMKDAIAAVITAPAVPGDVDSDGDVDLDDFAILKFNFGVGVTRAEGDLNADGVVDLDDFVVLKRNFGTAAVPEPTTILVMTAAGLPLLLKRKRSAR